MDDVAVGAGLGDETILQSVELPSQRISMIVQGSNTLQLEPEGAESRFVRTSSYHITPGSKSKGYHASGFPIYDLSSSNPTANPFGFDEEEEEQRDEQYLGFEADEENEDQNRDLAMPSSMKYSEKGIYDNTPAQQASAEDDGVAQQRHDSLDLDSVTRAAADKASVRLRKKEESQVKAPNGGPQCNVCHTCPGFQLHEFRKFCKWCRCHASSHKMRPKDNRASKVLLLSPGMLSDVGKEMKSLATIRSRYAWFPVGVSAAQIEAYFKAIPAACVPRFGTSGEKWRAAQLEAQLPKHDTNVNACSALSVAEKEAFKKFNELRIKTAFDIGEIMPCPNINKASKDCPECYLRDDGQHWAYCTKYSKKLAANPASRIQKPLTRTNTSPSKDYGARGRPSGGRCGACMESLAEGELVVRVARYAGGPIYYHPRCLLCSQCGVLLVDMRCYLDVGKEERGHAGAEERLFCERHWADNRKPRCAGCDETIFEKEYVFEGEKAYHKRHFCCAVCDTNLTETQTFVPHLGNPHCFECYLEHFADTCAECTCAINPAPGCGGKISHGNKHWHRACFVCKICKTALSGKPCMPRSDGLYCKLCYKSAKSSR